jgi:hypothetical protein
VTTVQIPTRGDVANYVQTTQLGGKTFLLAFRYNERDHAWYLDIADAAGPIRSGIKLVPNFLVLRNLVDSRWNVGQLVLVDTRPNPVPPLLAELGAAATLLYLEP